MFAAGCSNRTRSQRQLSLIVSCSLPRTAVGRVGEFDGSEMSRRGANEPKYPTPHRPPHQSLGTGEPTGPARSGPDDKLGAAILRTALGEGKFLLTETTATPGCAASPIRRDWRVGYAADRQG